MERGEGRRRLTSAKTRDRNCVKHKTIKVMNMMARVNLVVWYLKLRCNWGGDSITSYKCLAAWPWAIPIQSRQPFCVESLLPLQS